MRHSPMVLIAFILLAACTSTPNATLAPVPTTTALPTLASTATATLVSTATVTLIPTVTPTATPKLPDTPVPTSTPTPLPWREDALIKPDFPQTFNNDNNPAYLHFPIFGSAVSVAGPLKVDVSMQVLTNSNTPRDSSNGIWLYNGIDDPQPGFKGIYLVNQSGAWVFGYKKENTNVIYQRLVTTPNLSMQFSVIVMADGKTVAITLPDGTERIVTLNESLGTTIVAKAQTGPNSSLTISRLSLSQLPNNEPTATQNPTETLGTLAQKHGITFGVLSDLSDWQNPHYFQALKEFNLLINSDMSQSVLDKYGFAFADSQVNFARVKGLAFREQHLIWHEDVPDRWSKGNLSKEQVQSIMQGRINTLLTRYPDIREWVVVNEAILCSNGSCGYAFTKGTSRDIFYQALGPSYIDMAFHYARDANPRATLIYNDFDIETPGPKADYVYNMIRDLKAKGTPIDAVGMQFHMKATNPPSKADMITNMKRFASLGVGIYITELDVNLFGLPGTKEDKWAKQAKIYKDIVEACLESGVCKSVTIFGVSDKDSWLLKPEFQSMRGGEAPLIFDDNYNPKPAYFAIRDALLGK